MFFVGKLPVYSRRIRKQKLLGHLSGLCNSCRDAVGRLTFLGAMVFCGRAIEKKIRLMEEILHQLRVVVYPTIIFRVLYIPGGCLGFLPSTVFANVLPLKD